MKRRLFNILAALSLVLCIGASGLWVRSLWVCELINIPWELYPQTISSVHGVISINDARIDRYLLITCNHDNSWYVCDNNSYSFNYFKWNKLGFDCYYDDEVSSYVLNIPDWFLVLLFALLPVYWFIKRRNHLLIGCCQKCGYDLRASKDTCPECGTAIPTDLVRKPMA